MLYMLIFPLWCKWLIVNPMPSQYWHGEFKPFPLLYSFSNDEEVLQRQMTPKIRMTSIPQSAGNCNYSCSDWRGYRTSEMNFRVNLELNDSDMAKDNVHTVYPVLLASADFKDWWVVGDKRFASPRPFWSAQTARAGKTFAYVTDACTRPPQLPSVPAEEQYTGSYLLGCVVWHPDSLKILSSAVEVTDAQIAEHCYSVGGVCGWSCESSIPPQRLPGCSAQGRIEVTPKSFAGKQYASANFQGEVKMHECLDNSPGAKCSPKQGPFSTWKCHKCKYDPTTLGEDDTRRLSPIAGLGPVPGLLGPVTGTAAGSEDATAAGASIYTSLPKIKVSVSGVDDPEGFDVLSQPMVFVLASSAHTPGRWRNLYKEDVKTMPPVPVDAAGRPLEGAISDAEEEQDSRPQEMAGSLHAMGLDQENRITMDSEWCFGSQGPLYLVACAVNGSIYNGDGFFQGFQAGQQVAPPPFNDRCLTVTGRCAHACSPHQSPMANCTAEGIIDQSKLVSEIRAERNAERTAVWIFCYMLLLGFAIKVATLCPGVFSSYSHFRRYDPMLTSSLRYINVSVPSVTENKYIVLRSLIGGVAAMPKDCDCRYHVTFLDDSHRTEQREMFQKLVSLIGAIPATVAAGYADNLRQFFKLWVEETKKMDVNKLRGNSSEAIDPEIADKLCGFTTLDKLKKHSWSSLDPAIFRNLDLAVEDLRLALKSTNASRFDLTHDYAVDWEPKDRNSLALRVHYLARALPLEDERTVKSQHVAPGMFYYKVPFDASNEEWLGLRQKAQEMHYGLEEEQDDQRLVPLVTSRGRPGSLNFAETYLYCHARRPENHYGNTQDMAPCLYSVCDPYHQFQPDFFQTTIPHFFDAYGNLDEEVGFTQCPQHFHELQDKTDYLDNNNAQFFRFHSMIQNCAGGVSAWGTNCTRMIPHTEDPVWVAKRERVRGAGGKRRAMQMVERAFFPESCKVEHLAFSIDDVLDGKRSQFINRRLSYGMAKSATDALASMQRSCEGSVVIWLQSFFGSRGFTLWLTFFAFLGFIVSLFWLMKKASTDWALVEHGILDKHYQDAIMEPIVSRLKSFANEYGSDYFHDKPELMKDYVGVLIEFTTWLLSVVACLGVIFLVTELLKGCQGLGMFTCCTWPSEMRWWGRLVIRMHQVSYFLWFWLVFFWIAFNYWNVFATQGYHFSRWGMFSFIMIIQLLNWGMTLASSTRYQTQASMEANEVVSLSMDNLWRSTQAFYITAPIILYSIAKAMQDYCRYHFYGEDITFSTGPEREATTVSLVKYWTTLLIVGAVAAWVYFFLHFDQLPFGQGALSSCIIVTLIALDVLHPCAYLWLGQQKLSREEAAKMSWGTAITSPRWWERCIYRIVLNQACSGFIKWLGPACFLALPFLILVMPYMGVNLAFMMLTGTTNM